MSSCRPSSRTTTQLIHHRRLHQPGIVESPHEHDADLWVIVSNVPGHCFLGGNAHTHRGHIHAWSEELGKLVTITKYDVVDASPQAQTWLRGFLVGNEPDFAQWLGEPWDIAEADYRTDSPLYQAWQRDLRRFREDGWIRIPVERPGE
jgi:hypothetical protein